MELKWQFPWFDFRGINIAEMLIWDRSRGIEVFRCRLVHMAASGNTKGDHDRWSHGIASKVYIYIYIYTRIIHYNIL